MDERAALLDRMVQARSPDELATAIYEARAWLAAHPDDRAVASDMERLMVAQRQILVE